MIGLIGRKIGMTRIYAEGGSAIAVTIVEAKPSVISKLKTLEKDGYSAVQLGQGVKKKANKALKTSYEKDKLKTPAVIKEFKMDSTEEYKVGDNIDLGIFDGKNFLDVTAVSKGKGFQGVIKRHGFGGGPGSHGSHFHRAPGSVGMCAYPARIFKGKKMPGQMGSEVTTVQNLKVVKIDKENNLILLKGSVPGKNKGIVYLRESIKKINQAMSAEVK